MSRRKLTTCVLALAAVAVPVGAPSAVAKKSSPPPAITKVSPMRVNVGGTLVIQGRNFKSKAKSNTVIFSASNGRSAFVKPRRASRKKLVLTVTARVSRLLTVRSSSQRPTRLKLRVLAGKFSAFTSRRLSPVVVGLGGGQAEAERQQELAAQTQRFSGNGGKNLGTIKVPTDSTLTWTCDGDIFSVRGESSLGIFVNSQAHSGDSAVAAGTYTGVLVNAIGNWTITIAPNE